MRYKLIDTIRESFFSPEYSKIAQVLFCVNSCISQLFVAVAKISEKNDVEEGFILAHHFRQSMLDWLHWFGLEMKQNIMVEVYGRGKLLTLWQLGSQERKKEEGARDKVYLSRALPQ